jgi:hypothetical protein
MEEEKEEEDKKKKATKIKLSASLYIPCCR